MSTARLNVLYITGERDKVLQAESVLAALLGAQSEEDGARAGAWLASLGVDISIAASLDTPD